MRIEIKNESGEFLDITIINYYERSIKSYSRSKKLIIH